MNTIDITPIVNAAIALIGAGVRARAALTIGVMSMVFILLPPHC